MVGRSIEFASLWTTDFIIRFFCENQFETTKRGKILTLFFFVVYVRDPGESVKYLDLWLFFINWALTANESINLTWCAIVAGTSTCPSSLSTRLRGFDPRRNFWNSYIYDALRITFLLYHVRHFLKMRNKHFNLCNSHFVFSGCAQLKQLHWLVTGSSEKQSKKFDSSSSFTSRSCSFKGNRYYIFCMNLSVICCWRINVSNLLVICTAGETYFQKKSNNVI